MEWAIVIADHKKREDLSRSTVTQCGSGWSKWFWMEQTDARPKSGLPLRNPKPTKHEAFVAPVPSCVLRSGAGIFTVKLSHEQRQRRPKIIEFGRNFFAKRVLKRVLQG